MKGPWTLYRGVAGCGKSRWIRGYSWTDSIDRACWFAARFDLPSPAVFETVCDESRLLAYTNQRGESEYIVSVSDVKRVKMTKDKVFARAAVYIQDAAEIWAGMRDGTAVQREGAVSC